MKFMLMMQGTRSGWESMGSWSPADIQAHIRFMKDLNKELTSSGELVLAEGLDLPHNAKIVRAEKTSATVVTDGPFAESKEFLAGFWIVECASQKRVIEIAAKASTAPGRGGVPIGIPIEVRQVMSAPNIEE
ncbi:MAG TPA: YciI family protein [Planctomycetota bacterium]